MSIKQGEAAARLCNNLVTKLDPGDAQDFAAFVAARVAQVTGMVPGEMAELMMRFWEVAGVQDMTPRQERVPGPGQFLSDGSCSCNQASTVYQYEGAPLVVHRGAACAEFRNRFPQGGPTRARDEAGWDNGKIQGTKDDTEQRFALLEMDR